MLLTDDENTRIKAYLRTTRNRHSRWPATWRARAHYGKIEWRAHKAVRKAGRAAQTPPIRFCVFAPGRTGSTLLFDLANSHPDIQCETRAEQTELLHDIFVHPRAFIEARAKMCPARAYGFKTKFSQMAIQYRLHPFVLLQSLHESGWKMITLTRRNLLRQTLSVIIAEQTSVWHRVRKENGEVASAQNGAKEKKKLDINVPFLLQKLDRAQESQACMEIIFKFIPHLKLEYEDDLFTSTQQSATMARVFDYLGLPPHDVSTRFERTGTNDWRDAISNPRAVEDALRGTQYEKFLDAP